MDHQKVKVVARIRQTNISETYSASSQTNNQGTTQKLENPPTQSTTTPKFQLQASNSGAINTAIAANSSLDKDGKVCIFTSSSIKEKSLYVAASGNPIKKQLLNDYVKTDKNIIQYRHSILENANIFKFDHAMGPKTTNSSLYKEQCEDLIQKAMSQGVSSTFIIIGPSKAGKKYTVKGGEQQNEKGILSRSVDTLIELSKLQTEGAGINNKPNNKLVIIKFQIYAIYNNEVVDLLANPNEDADDDVSEFELTFSGEYRKYFVKSRERLKQVGQGDQTIRKLHIIYKFLIYKNELVGKKQRGVNSPNGGLVSTVTFLHCADFSKSRLSEFTVIGDYLADVATRRDANLLEVPAYSNSKLITQITDSLNGGQDNHCVLICNVAGAYEHLSSSVDCLQFCSGVKERIDQYFEDIQTFNQDQEPLNALINQQGLSPEEQQAAAQGGSRFSNRSSPFGSGFNLVSVVQNNSSQQQGSTLKSGEEYLHVPSRNNTSQFQKSRGMNPTPKEIQKDLSNLIKDIYTFTDSTQGLTGREMNSWAYEREQELQSILKDIGQLPVDQQRQFDSTAIKIQETQQFLTQIKKNSPQLSLSRNASGELKNLNSSEDLGSIMSQYNKSKQSIMKPGSNENLDGNEEMMRSNGSIPQDYTQDNQSLNQSKRSVKQIREQIFGKIDEIINEFDQSKRSVKLGSNNRSGQRDMSDIISDRSGRNLKLLKELLADQNFLMKEKKRKLKAENKNLKESMGELEEELKEKVSKIQYLDDSVKQLQLQVEKDREIIHLKIEKEELLERNDEQLRAILERLKVKLLRKKEECSILKSNIDKAELHIAEERQNTDMLLSSLNREISETRIGLETIKAIKEELERENSRQKFDLESCLNSLKLSQDNLQFCEKRLENFQQQQIEDQQKGKDFASKQNLYERRINEAEDRAQALEHKLAKYKLKGAEEKNQITQERENEILKKKEAVNKLKAEVKELERKQNEMLAENKFLKQENVRLNNSSQEAILDAANKLKSNKELTSELESLQTEVRRLRGIQRDVADQQGINERKLKEENQNLQNILKKSETDLKIWERKVNEKNEEIELLKKEAILLDQEQSGQKDFIGKLERQNQFLTDLQHDDIERLEEKVEGLNLEVNELRKENRNLRQKETNQAAQLDSFKNAAAKQEQKLAKNKMIIQQLTGQLDLMDQRVQEIIQEKSNTMTFGQSKKDSKLPQKRSHSFKEEAGPSQRIETRSILKKPRFNVIDGALDYSEESDI